MGLFTWARGAIHLNAPMQNYGHELSKGHSCLKLILKSGVLKRKGGKRPGQMAVQPVTSYSRKNAGDSIMYHAFDWSTRPRGLSSPLGRPRLIFSSSRPGEPEQSIAVPSSAFNKKTVSLGAHALASAMQHLMALNFSLHLR